MSGQGPCVKMGDVVILKDKSVKQAFWKLAKVVELLRSNDGKERVALINVATDNGPPKVLKRSIAHLVPIEVNIGEENTVEAVDPNEAGNSDGVTIVEQLISSTRPCQAAAVVGELIRLTWTEH